jgi:phosphatidylethanolamine N-methyltransferase
LITEGLTDKVKGEIEKVLDLARPKIDELVAETKSMVADSTARLATLGTLGPLAGAFESPDQLLTGNVIEGDISKYSVHLPVTASSTLMMPSSPGCVGFELGDPITIYWTAPSDHSPKDWIGIYKVTSNPSKAATTFSSKGCWQYVGCEGQVAGKLVFEGETLPWDVGVYEIRYHYNDKYLVLAYTGIFEIQGMFITGTQIHI